MKPRILALIPLVVLIGCNKGPSFEGKWKAQVKQAGNSGDVQMELMPGGKAKTSVSFTQQGMAITMNFNGTWEAPDTTHLTVKAEDVAFDLSKITGANRVMVESVISSRKKEILEQANKQMVMPVKWQGNDRFEGTSGSEHPVFERVK